MKTTSYELSKELKELEVKQRSFSCWTDYLSFRTDPSPYLVVSSDYICNEDFYAAFTLDEILDMLPNIIYMDNLDIFLDFQKCGAEPPYAYYAAYNGLVKTCYDEFEHQNPAEAAGQLLVWCIENGYVKPEEEL